jgi:multimeric flavodoxin WrbA
MKALAINGSPRNNGNTAILLRNVLNELEKEDVATELVQLGGKKINGCVACYNCFKAKNGRCAVNDDIANECIGKMRDADAIILGSPTYFADCTAAMKALMERAGFVARANSDMFRRKVGAAVVAVRRAGAIHAFDSINHFFTITQMIIIGSSYWNIGIGREKGEVEKDEEGLATMTTLGKNMAWVLKKLHQK